LHHQRLGTREHAGEPGEQQIGAGGEHQADRHARDEIFTQRDFNGGGTGADAAGMVAKPQGLLGAVRSHEHE
jgi:hypothetical protein